MTTTKTTNNFDQAIFNSATVLSRRTRGLLVRACAARLSGGNVRGSEILGIRQPVSTMFPVEIWEKILKNIDAAHLVRLRIVSSVWNEIIAKHLQESQAWYTQCLKDIPSKYWLILLENSLYSTTLLLQRQKKLDDTVDHRIWMTIYRAWVKWSNIESLNAHTVNRFQPMPEHRPSEHITCCATLGELVAVGSTEGYIRVFNLRSNKLVFRVDQYQQVQDVKLCVQGKNSDKIVLIATSVNNKSRVWDITCQKCLMAMTGDVICAGYGYYCATLCHDKIIVYSARNESCFPVRLFVKEYNLKPSTQQYSNAKPIMKYASMTIDEQQLRFLSDTGLYCETSLQEMIESQRTLYTPVITYIGIPKNHKVHRYYLFNPCVSFCITEKGHLGISVYKKAWQIYNVYPFLEGKITALTYQLRVLVLGLDSGVVCVLFVQSVERLKAMDFKSVKRKRICIASEPIVCVNVMEINGDQRLLAATRSTVYHIKLVCD